jgi:hypothetical protein
MAGAVETLFKGPRKQDMSATIRAQQTQEEQIARQEKQLADQQAAEDAARRARAAAMGRGLLALDETGIGPDGTRLKGTLG